MKEHNVQTTFVNILDNLDPEVADRVKQKINKDNKEFQRVLRDMDPSKNIPAYFAKRSCSKCYGRGIMYSQYVFNTKDSAKADSNAGYVNCIQKRQIGCPCRKLKYKKWVTEVRKYYNALKAQTLEETNGS